LTERIRRSTTARFAEEVGMRLLHVSDWHLGRTTYGVSREVDHDAVLGEMVAYAREHAPDVIVHTGDLFDCGRPSYSDMARGVTALRELSACAPVVVLCGNHDSPQLFQLFSLLMGAERRIHFVDRARLPEEGGVLTFPLRSGRTARIALAPFVHAHRPLPGMDDSQSMALPYPDRIRRLQRLLVDGLVRGHDPSSDLLFFAAHLHVAGARPSHTERAVHIHESYATYPDAELPVAYAAYGHLHKPQALPRGTAGRFAGSPLQLDFGELGEEKSLVLVDVSPGRRAEVVVLPLRSGRRLFRFDGTLAELQTRAPGVGRSLCLVTVHSNAPTPLLPQRVRDLLPDAEVLQVTEVCRSTQVSALSSAETTSEDELSLTDAFRQYLVETGTRRARADRVVELFSHLLRHTEALDAVEFPEERILAAALQPGRTDAP
jgi:exonuclease SbcD